MRTHLLSGRRLRNAAAIAERKKESAGVLVVPPAHQCLHKTPRSRGGPETPLNTAPTPLSTVRQSHGKSSRLKLRPRWPLPTAYKYSTTRLRVMERCGVRNDGEEEESKKRQKFF
ncbi:hypothetical protein EYF80_031970 [Liparis tanakae]|uniref:Uncharacterized protein n=1 Tax=Liparis tanakae TaxID=230148 RepID=A0A4Z2GW91_9TELE|nr:hypothetical protein EYF80_031970 [Liparis tanakae]